MEKSGCSMGGFGCTFFFSLLGCNWWNNPLVFFERTCCFYLWLSSTDDAHSMVAAFLPAVAARCPRYTQTQEEEEKRESLSLLARGGCVCVEQQIGHPPVVECMRGEEVECVCVCVRLESRSTQSEWLPDGPEGRHTLYTNHCSTRKLCVYSQ